MAPDLHQRAGPQRGHSGEGEQPLHGGHRAGHPGRTGGRRRTRLRRHEAPEEEEERSVWCTEPPFHDPDDDVDESLQALSQGL